jgi:hypothetical protein
MVHRHRPLGDGGEREVAKILRLLLQRRVPDGQRVAIGADALAQMRGRLLRAMAFGGKP